MPDYILLNNPFHTTQEPDASLRGAQAASVLMHQGKLLTLKQDIVRLSDGRNASREYPVYPGAMMMIPPFDDGTVLMERQFCYLAGRMMVESPVGKLNPQEGALVCDKRELCEETDHMAEHQGYLTHIRPAVSYSIEFIDIYLA